MKLREVLQTEIWSKRTSRKLLIAFAVIVCGFLGWLEADWNWLTPMEVRAGRAALVDVDALQNSSSMTDEEFGVAENRAKQSVQNAIEASWTHRDKFVAYGLGNYLQLTSVERLERTNERVKILSVTNEETNRKLLVIRDQESKVLHQVLR